MAKYKSNKFTKKQQAPVKKEVKEGSRSIWEYSVTLKSDLCANSGYSYSGLIDNDCCYDEVGIPYIPSRRIKGVMREAAEMIIPDKDKILRLFGDAGMQKNEGFIIEDAYPEEYKEMRGYLLQQRKDDELKAFITPQNVLSVFTTVKAQTKLVDGVADDQTLRYTRVVNQYDPFAEKKEQKELVFKRKSRKFRNQLA